VHGGQTRAQDGRETLTATVNTKQRDDAMIYEAIQVSLPATLHCMSSETISQSLDHCHFSFHFSAVENNIINAVYSTYNITAETLKHENECPAFLCQGF